MLTYAISYWCRFVEYFNVEPVAAQPSRNYAATTSSTSPAHTRAPIRPGTPRDHFIGPMPSGYYGSGGMAGDASSSSELWLVFRDEGQSLHDLLYDMHVEGNRARLERWVANVMVHVLDGGHRIWWFATGEVLREYLAETSCC